MKTYMTNQQWERTKKLLRKTKQLGSIDAYLTMKKILIVSINIDRLQKKDLDSRAVWISYESVLQRNEKLLKKFENNKIYSSSRPLLTEIKIKNGLGKYDFFGIPSSLIYNNIPQALPKLIYQNWNNHAQNN